MSAHSSYSLRSRLLLWLLVPLIAIGLVALADTWREAMATANQVSDRVLAGSALAIAERVVVAENGSLEVDIPYVALEMLTSAAQDRVFYRIDGPSGFITGYQTLPTIDGLPQEASGFTDDQFRGEPIRLTSLHRAASTGVTSVPFLVTVAETRIARTQLAQTILLRSALRLGVLILAAAIIAWVAVTYALRPLYRLRDAIAERSPNDLHPIEDEVPREVRGLVDTVNSFMGRLGSTIDAMRHFTGNASHQLRTPLAIVRTQLTLATRADSIAEVRQATQVGDDAVRQAERVIGQLLLLAKVDEASLDSANGFAAADLTELARQITGEHVSRAHGAGVDLGFEGTTALPVRAEPLLIGEMIRNLIDNAIAYAGHGAEATVSTRRDGDGAVIQLEDNGPGISHQERPRVLQRFGRGQTGDKPGAGLGLPIVEEIAALFGGVLTIASGPDGRGLCVSIRFPLAVS